MSGVRIERLTGARLEALLPDLAWLRITVFRAFPYLYDGSLDYEQRYLQTYVRTPDSVIVGAFDGDRVVGASTGLPLAAEPASLTDTFTAHGFAVAEVFYFGESVLLPDYRGHGVGGEGRLQHQVLGLVAGQEQFGQRDEIGAGRHAVAMRGARLGAVAGEIAEGRVELRHGQPKSAGHSCLLRPRLDPA